MADRFTNNCTPDYTLTDFISEFNKYCVRNISVEEYEKCQIQPDRLLTEDELFGILDRKFIIYKGYYFQYISEELNLLVHLVLNANPFDKNWNDVIKYIYHKYQKDTSSEMVFFIKDKKEYILEHIIIPKYYEELQKKPKHKTIVDNTKYLVESEQKTKSVLDEEVTKTKETPVKKEKIKKKPIPLALKRNVWNKHIGETVGKTLCLCCKLTDITQMNFSCGHIISEFNGGDMKLDNLKPICVSCNSSIGTKNMDEFIADFGL
jgi:hypothetical protein